MIIKYKYKWEWLWYLLQIMCKKFSTKGNLTKHLKKDICIKPFEAVGKTKLENHELVPFDNNWDTSKILDEEKKYLICYSTTKYSELLKYILKMKII